MAVSNLAAVSTVLSQYFDANLARQWNRSSVLLSKLQAAPDSGKALYWTASTSGQVADVHTEGADVDAAELLIDAKVPMTLSWALYRNAFGLSEHQLEAALQSKGSAQEIINLLGESLYEAISALSSKLNSHLYIGNPGSSHICGLDYSLLSTGTYAGQNVAVVSSLQSNLDTNSGVNRALTVELMNKMESAIFSDCGMKPDLIVTSPGVWSKYSSLFEPIRRVNGMDKYNTSADELYFRDIPVIRDKDCPTGKMYFLNTNYVKMSYMPMVNFGDSLGFQVKLAAGSNGMNQEVSSIPVKVQALAKTGDSVKFFCRTAMQLKVKRPNSCGIISYISE